jgi:8-hydroxy-5-deazaflavin:NADPH oxidoreductase
MSKKIGVLGAKVGEVLANGFLKYGHSVRRASRDVSKLDEWLATAQSAAVSGAKAVGERASTGTLSDTASWADILVLAVKGSGATDALDQCGHDNLRGKVIIDTTNPIADGPPDHGVVRYFTGPNESLMERLQAHVPAARFVKAFNSVGNAFMVDPHFEGGPPTMFICGNDPAAKSDVTTLLDQFGWAVEDMGTVHGARAIEPLCQLWCIPGMTGKGWSHAFKLLR